MRTYTCKKCPHSEEGNSPSVLIAHARDKHGMKQKRTGGGRARAAVLAAAVVEVDKESNLLSQCTTLFIHAGTDRDADHRVLEYLATRFGPAAYADETEADEESDEDPVDEE